MLNYPKITVRDSPYKFKYKENLLGVNPMNIHQPSEVQTDDIIYMASEISQLIAKLLLDTTVYVELSRLFKISLNKAIEFVEIIIAENLSNEEFIHDQSTNGNKSLSNYFFHEEFLCINFLSATSSRLCGLDEFLTIPLKNLTTYGAELIDQPVKQLTPQILLSTPSEMFWDSVPFPSRNSSKGTPSFLFSQNYYSNPDNDPANLLAIDCEMVNTGDQDNLEVARVSIVRCCRGAQLTTLKGIKQWLSLSKGTAYEVVYDEYVKPKTKIVDYLTKYSGITESVLENVDTTLADVHVKLKTLITSNTILVGHSIQSDLKALKIYHPYIIDTSNIYNTSGDFTRKPGLKPLSEDMLRQEIRQTGKKVGHDPIEDAQTALKLVMLKLTKDLNFGNKTRITYVPPNYTLGEWKDVSESSNKPKVTVDLSEATKQKRTITRCVVETDEVCVPVKDIESVKEQMKRDKFTLLKERPAVVKTTDLLFKLQIAIQMVVSTDGIIGRQQISNTCPSVIKVSDDSSVAKETVINGHHNKILISVLSDFSSINRSSDVELQNKKLLSIRKNIKKIVDGIPKKSAVFVILPGSEGAESIGKFFWKIS